MIGILLQALLLPFHDNCLWTVTLAARPFADVKQSCAKKVAGFPYTG